MTLAIATNKVSAIPFRSQIRSSFTKKRIKHKVHKFFHVVFLDKTTNKTHYKCLK